MAKDPAVLLYTQDFLVGTSMLTPIQKGHYITILCHQQQSATGSLKIEDIKLLMGKDFDRHWFILQSKFEADGNGFFNKRMRTEINKRKEYSDRQKAKVTKRWDEYRGNTAVDTTVIPIIENENEIKKGGMGENKKERWNTNPSQEEIESLELTEMEVNANIEFIWNLKHVHTKPKEVRGYWKAFKIQQFTGGKFYQDRARCLQHFRNWIKGQDISSLPIHNSHSEPSNGIGTRLKSI